MHWNREVPPMLNGVKCRFCCQLDIMTATAPCRGKRRVGGGGVSGDGVCFLAQVTCTPRQKKERVPTRSLKYALGVLQKEGQGGQYSGCPSPLIKW